ncbi:hypothetical protein ECE50_009085 [Chitinophaga sp. Mgbs1]|uniref:Uncharacterized protein n=1 Tax=Chitinophaga solisilvae TaxID=1233460 RepID=A0A3S1JCC7_9BACT|nr:hypothetical protein [Chitinophaga solisilvae]
MKQFFLYVLLLVLPAHLLAAATPLAVVPFELKGDRIYIICKVNKTDSLRFMFDTGNSNTAIKEQVGNDVLKLVFDGKAENESVNGVSTIQTSSGNTLSIGPLSVPGVMLISLPFTEELDGVLGLDIMKKYAIEIDYSHRKMSFYNPDTYVYPGKGAKIPVKFSHNVPIIQADIFIDGARYSGYYELDSGSDRICDLHTPFAQQFIHRLPSFAKAATIGANGTRSDLLVVNFPQLRIGGYQFYNIPGSLATTTEGLYASPDFEGVFGNAFLKRFNITYVLGKNHLYLTPNNYVYTPFYDFLVK